MFYRFKKQLNEGTVKETIKRIANIFGIDNYSCVEEKPHGFPFLPVAYARNEDGPCWAPVQRNIEDYEEAYSYLCENNKAYAFPMLKLKGDGDDIAVVGDTNGGAKTIQITDTDGDAEFIDGTDASNASLRSSTSPMTSSMNCRSRSNRLNLSRATCPAWL